MIDESFKRPAIRNPGRRALAFICRRATDGTFAEQRAEWRRKRAERWARGNDLRLRALTGEDLTAFGMPDLNSVGDAIAHEKRFYAMNRRHAERAAAWGLR